MKRDKEILARKIRENFPEEFGRELIALIKPAIRISPQNNHFNEKSISKFGGLPQVNKNGEWPRTAKKNKPYAFLLQLNLEDINSYDIENQLPEKGILSFWFNLDTWDDGKVIYNKDSKNLIKAKPPVEFKEEEIRKKLPLWKRVFTKRNEFQLFKECSIDFELEYHAPSWDSLQAELYHIKGGTKSKNLEFNEVYIDEYIESEKSDHHLLGYYVGLQTSIYEVFQFTSGRYPQKMNENLIEKGLKWKLLLQIDSDRKTNMSWCDWGKLLFFIHEDDLKIKNFDNVIVHLDTT